MLVWCYPLGVASLAATLLVSLNLSVFLKSLKRTCFSVSFLLKGHLFLLLSVSFCRRGVGGSRRGSRLRERQHAGVWQELSFLRLRKLYF